MRILACGIGFLPINAWVWSGIDEIWELPTGSHKDKIVWLLCRMCQGCLLSAEAWRREDLVLITDWLWPFLTSGFRWDDVLLFNRPLIGACVCILIPSNFSRHRGATLTHWLVHESRMEGKNCFYNRDKRQRSDRECWEVLNILVLYYSWACC